MIRFVPLARARLAGVELAVRNLSGGGVMLGGAAVDGLEGAIGELLALELIDEVTRAWRRFAAAVVHRGAGRMGLAWKIADEEELRFLGALASAEPISGRD